MTDKLLFAVSYLFVCQFIMLINGKEIKIGYSDSIYFLKAAPAAWLAVEDATESGMIPQDVNIR